MLKVNLDKSGDLTSVNGYAAPGPRPLRRPADQRRRRRRARGQRRQGRPADRRGRRRADTSGIEAKTIDLVVYRMGAIKGDPGKAVLAYVVEVTNDDNVRDMVFVDAAHRQGDQPLLDDRPRPGARARRGDRHSAQAPDASPTVWEEGDAFPGALNEDQQNLVTSAGESYWLFKNTFGRDSYDGAGATMIDGQQRPAHQLPERQLERRHHQLLQRRHLRRRGLARVGPRLHRVHLRPDLPVPAGCAQRVLLRRLGRDRRPDQRPRGRGRGRPHRQASRRGCARRHSRRRSSCHDQHPGRVAGPCTAAAAAAFGPSFDETGVTTDVVVGTDAGRRRRSEHRPTAARRSPTPRRSPASSPTSTVAPAPSQPRSTTPRPPVRPASSWATTPRAVPITHGRRGRHLRRHGHPGRRHPVQVGRHRRTSRSRTEDTQHTDGLLPLADRREVGRPSAERSATCGTRPATTTPAR